MAMNEPENKTKEQRYRIKQDFLKQLIGGVLVVVTNVDQAIVAETYGARGVIVMNYRVLLATNRDQVSRGTDPVVLKSIMSAVHLPVIGRARLGHITEARIMQSCGVSAIEESPEVGVAHNNYIEKHPFNVPIISYADNLDSALQRISEGATMIASRSNSNINVGGSTADHVPDVYI
ncbi:Pyridoxal 5'-phosphate synthase subunit snz1, partial [Coemansia sp. RSA 1365]